MFGLLGGGRSRVIALRGGFRRGRTSDPQAAETSREKQVAKTGEADHECSPTAAVLRVFSSISITT